MVWVSERSERREPSLWTSNVPGAGRAGFSRAPRIDVAVQVTRVDLNMHLICIFKEAKLHCAGINISQWHLPVGVFQESHDEYR
jgi:hypothetical protein